MGYWVDALLGIFTCPAKLDNMKAANKVIREHTTILENEKIALSNKLREAEDELSVMKRDEADYQVTISRLIDENEMLEKGIIPEAKHPKQIYYENKYPKLEDGYHIARPLPTNNKDNMMRLDVRDFLYFQDNNQIKRIANSYDHFGEFGYVNLNEGSLDEIAVKCCIWVQNHFTYRYDHKQTRYSEYWFYPSESLALKYGDCEDGAILMKNIMLAAGIPDWQARITFALVRNRSKWVGHLFVNYYSIEHDKWVILDWCYYPNKKKIEDRREYKDVPEYGEVKLSFTKEFVWRKDEGGD